LGVFENTDPDELAEKIDLVRYLFDRRTPFYTRQELSSLIRRFKDHLHVNRARLVSTGYPATRFASSHWLHTKLGQLYPVKVPYSIRAKKTKAKDDPVIIYTWVKEWPSRLAAATANGHCTYEEAPYIDDLTPGAVKYIEDQRAKLLNVKMRILDIVSGYLSGRETDECLLGECINSLSESISQRDVLTLNEVDKIYTDLFCIRDLPDGTSLAMRNPLTGFERGMDAGGLKSIMEFIFLAEKELTIGKLHRTKTRLRALIGDRKPRSYYYLTLLPQIADIDNVLSDFLAHSDREDQFNRDFNRRLMSEFKDKLKTPLLVRPKVHNTVEDFARFLESSGNLGLKIRGSYRKWVSARNGVCPIKLPPDTRWEDITIKFLDGHNVVITAKGFRIETDFKRMGFENRKNRKPNKQWLFLQLLSIKRGGITWNDPDADETFKKKKQLLSQTLKAYFQMYEDPFLPYRQEKAYKIRINLIPEGASR
jgi:hypothetical protein